MGIPRASLVFLWAVAALVPLAVPPAVRAAAPTLRFETLSMRDGLSQSTVLAIHQDRQGFLWVGTEDGLNRFDGSRFTVYRRRDGDPSSLPHDVVWSIVEDAAGDVWVGTEGGGIARWDRSTDRFERFESGPGQPSLTEVSVRTLHFDARGVLWVGTRDAGVLRVEPRTHAVTAFRSTPGDPRSLSDDRIYTIASDADGRVWVGGEGGLDRFEPASATFIRFPHGLERPGGLPSRRVRHLAVDPDGALWVATFGGGLARLDPRTLRPTVFRHVPDAASTLSHDEVRVLHVDRGGRLWAGTSGGLNLFDRGRQTFTRYVDDPSSPTSLGDEQVLSLFEDRGGVLWVGTRSAGLKKWHRDQARFGHVARSEGHGLNHSSVTAFTEDRGGRLWVGTFGGGLNVIDRASGATTILRQTDGARGPGRDRVMALLRDRQDRIWVGTYDGGVSRLDPGTDRFVTYRHDRLRPSSLAADAVSALFEDSRGRVWVGTFGGGLDRYDPVTDGFVHFPYRAGDPASLSSPRVLALAEDRLGRIWVGTGGGGLTRLDPVTGRTERVALNGAAGASGSAVAIVFSVHVDPRGTVWLGTQGSGLLRLTGADTERLDAVSVTRYGQSHGLTNHVVYGVLPGSGGDLWLSTNDGLFRFDPRANRFQPFDERDGVQASEFNSGASFRSATGELFFGGINGFNAFRPEVLRATPRVPRVVLTDVRTFGQPRQGTAPAFSLDRLALGYWEDIVTLRFAALDFAAPRGTRYAYRLEGLDNRWIDAGDGLNVTLTDLAAGRYTLRVKATADGRPWDEVEESLALALDVEAPPWQRWWAYLAYAAAIAAAAAAAVRMHRRRLEREAVYSRTLEADVRARTAELAERNRLLEQVNAKLTTTSLTDTLTGLHNRRYLFDRVVTQAPRGDRRRPRPVADDEPRYEIIFMMVDLDRFKPINDTYGHAAGDEVIQQVATRAQQVCRPSDELIRWGGDEFLLVIRFATRTEVVDLADRLRLAIASEPFDAALPKAVMTSCSIGFAAVPRGSVVQTDWESVLAIADAALYDAKRLGGNTWVGYLGQHDRQLPDAAYLRDVGTKELVSSGALEVLECAGSVS